MNKNIKKIVMVPFIFLIIFVCSFLVTAEFIEIRNTVKKTDLSDNFSPLSEKWYASISYLGYNDISDSYNYVVYYYIENEDGTWDRCSKALLLPVPPSTAVLYIEQNETAIKSSNIIEG